MTRSILGLLIALALVVFTAAIYGALPLPPSPDSILSGEVVAPGIRRTPGVFLGPILALGVWLVLWLFPKVDPWREPGEEYGVSYWIIGNLVVLIMAALHLSVVGLALDWPVDTTILGLVLPGIFFLAVGSYLPSVPVNWALGVRTPWALRSERVWLETHRLAGRTFMIGGLVFFSAIFLTAGHRPLAAAAGIIIAGGIPALYSYLVWRRVERVGGG
jgi:uncharacterized membrane protein